MEERRAYPDDEANNEAENLPIEEGSRVFYEDGDGNSYKRAVVKEISDTYLVLPVEEKDDSGSYLLLPEESIIRDTQEWTLRFQVGEKVVCIDDSGFWMPATVTELFPVDQTRNGCFVQSYGCDMDAPNEHGGSHAINHDNNDYIMKHPQSFRFSVGDEVIFASDKAAGLSRRNCEPWIRGKVTKVDLVGRDDYYVVYECRYKHGKRSRTCHILCDDDEHVASPDASARERLLETIGQDGSYEHINYLMKSSALDATALRDLLLSTAIENASYNMLLWLQENADVNLARIGDASFDGLLHQIAKSPHAERFLVEAAKREWVDYDGDEPNIQLNNLMANVEDRLFDQTNGQGRSFLHELIISGKQRALDIVLSPRDGLAWRLEINVHVMTRDKKGLNLQDTCRLLGRFEMEKMIDEFVEWRSLYDLSCKVRSYGSPSFGPNDLTSISKFGERQRASSIAHRLVRFRQYWDRKMPKSSHLNLDIDLAIIELCNEGSHAALSWLIDAEPSLLKVTHKAWNVAPSPAEFAQPVGACEATSDEVELDLVGSAVLGDNDWHGKFDDDLRRKYILILTEYYHRVLAGRRMIEDRSLVEYIKNRIGDSGDDSMLDCMLEDKLCLLEDDRSLQDRLKVLDYLVKEKGMPVPNAVSVIKWRQCGILRWLTENGFTDLQEAACENATLVREAKDLTILGGKKIPRTVTVGVLLCFASIEFDDLQTFQWLVGEQSILLSSMVLNGLNATLCCAFLGRAEMVLWLVESQSQSVLTSLLEEKCTRPPWNGYYAAHLAAEKGFTFLADVLLSSGCPAETSSGKNVAKIAKTSNLESVRAWGAEKEKPLQLEKDIQRLLHYLSKDGGSVNDIKRHIVQSKCMHPTRWNDCDYCNVDFLGPLGKSYSDILELCCKSEDPDFVVWLCQELSPTDSSDEYSWNIFWRYESLGSPCHLDVAALRNMFASETDDRLLQNSLNLNWAKDVICVEPRDRNHVLKMMLTCLPSESSTSVALRKFRHELLIIDALDQVMDSATDEIKRLFAQGGKGKQIDDMIEVTLSLAGERTRLQNGLVEDYFPSSGILSSDRSVNLEGYLRRCDYGKDHPLRGMVEWYGASPADRSCLYVVLAVEGYFELIKWLHSGREEHMESKTGDCDCENCSVHGTRGLGGLLSQKKFVGGLLFNEV